MNVNVYLPDDLGKRAKELPRGTLSQLLRDAVAGELERREAMSKTLTETETFELALEDKDGNPYKGRITGTAIDGDGDIEIFVTADERVIFYDESKLDYWVVEDPEQELSGWPNALRVLGITPVIDL